MAFLNNLGKKITDAGQGVAQQTKNFTDVARLNSTISDKEKSISQLYAAIGKNYYDQHKNDEESPEKEKLEQITALLAEIDQCRTQIQEIKGVAVCPSCGAEVAQGAAFCSACGANLKPSQEDGGQADGQN
ncbi:MAG: zinc ribbon domain-containing protein [Oscillospiraceae bacterium]|nr:zinc ribbon domain-containing protein [Oscillospiraceae bacterium]